MKKKVFTCFNALGMRFSFLGLMLLVGFTAFGQTTVPITTSGSWTVPVGVTSIQVEAWGGGGGGGGTASVASKSGGGGSGGCYVKNTTIAVTPGESLTITVGAGGAGGVGSGSVTPSTDGGFSSVARSATTLIKAGGGIKGIYLSAGGAGTGGVAVTTDNFGFEGSFSYKGGDGANGINGTGGVIGTPAVGGGAAGTNGNGSGITAGTGGGAGAAAITASGSGNPGNAPGGGGGGGASAAASAKNGGAGGAGQVKITYTPITPTVTLSSASLTGFITSPDVASASQTINVSGLNLTSDITVSPAITNFEISLSPSTGYGSSVTIPFGSGTVTSTPIYVRIKLGATAGALSESIIFTSTGAVSQTLSSSGVVTTNYYYNGTGSLASVASWGTNTNGTGSNPTDFITLAGQIFNIRNTASVSTTAAWTVAGTGSKIVVGDPSVAAVTLTVTSGFAITTTSPAVVDIPAASSGANSLVLQNTSTPTLGTMDANSEVHYQAALNTGTTKTFGKLFIDGNGTTTTFTGTPSIQTSMTVAASAIMATGNNSGNYITVASGGTVTINGTFQTQKTVGFMSTGISPGSTYGTLQSTGSITLALGASSVIEFNRFSSGTAQTVDARTDYVNLTISGLDNNKNFAAGTLAVSGALTIGVTGTSGLSQPSATTINYTGTSAQTMPSAITTYSNLGISGGGTKTASANTAVTGNLTLAASTVLDMNGFTLTLSSGSMVKGTGTLKTNVTNPAGSTIAPGASPGTTTIDGTLTNVGDWAIELAGATAGTEYDQVVVTGATTLTSGTVNVTLLSGYDPPLGTSFVILSAASVTGTFTAINLPTLAGGKTWATPVYGASTVTISVNAVLSVELSNFQVKANQKSALLSWTTASEKDNAYFNIEQSKNGIDFQVISQVKGQGTTATATTYNFEHSTPSVGINYYRLKQVDFNGLATYSGVKSIVFGKTGLVIKNTLVHDALDIITNEDAAAPLSIFNISGQQVFNSKTQGAQRIDVSALPAGLYIVRTATGEVGRFVKQ